MRRVLWLSFVFGIGPLLAEDVVKFDTPEVRVLKVTDMPGKKSAMHTHTTNRVMIFLDDGQMTLTNAQGERQHVRWRAGEVRWSPAGGPHTSENAGRTPYRIVEVELKNSAGGVLPETPLDPVLVDPKRYKVEFENPQVRVLRARYGPREAGVLHEHVLNRVVVLLTHQDMKVTSADGKAIENRGEPGDVTMGGPAKHREENLSDRPFEVAVVEIKR
ncbi:MAG TPA: cupin domain-containing protein [Bryobacteraceae bacterium]|nr:cupin domain-containing protein [Bryobacteraceae bacterium]